MKPGHVVAVVGAGPVGLAATMTAGPHGASRVIGVDVDDNRLAMARDTFGATHTVTPAARTGPSRSWGSPTGWASTYEVFGHAAQYRELKVVTTA